jgi:hypothetical protein
LILFQRRTTDGGLPPLEIEGDRDLIPVAAILWVGSVARVIAGLAENETFHVEATLALFCVIAVPCWIVWSLVDGAAQKRATRVRKPSETTGPASVIRLAHRRDIPTKS